VTGIDRKTVEQITPCPGCGVESSENYDGRGFCWDCATAKADKEIFGGQNAEPVARRRQSVDGATFAFNTVPAITGIWGSGDDVLWAKGEPLMIAAPQGVGKTTLLERIALARLGIRSETVLGYPVTPSDHKLLYIAADRPMQAARSLRRMVGDNDRELLAQRLVVWQGPLPFDLTKSPPDALANFTADEHGAADLMIDSMKDITVGLSDDQVGAKVNMALQACIARGIDVVDAHHQRKANADNKQPKTLDDVYGSTWLTAGHGSVLLLWGQPGDPIITLHHLKSPANEIGPLDIALDFQQGQLTVRAGTTIHDLLNAAGNDGLEVADAARQIYATKQPTGAHREKTRRQLEALVVNGQATVKPGAGKTDPARYFRAATDDTVKHREAKREAFTNASRTFTNPHKHSTRELHAPSRTSLESTSPPLRGDVNENVNEQDDQLLERLRAQLNHEDNQDTPF
jgi:AAA domain